MLKAVLYRVPEQGPVKCNAANYKHILTSNSDHNIRRISATKYDGNFRQQIPGSSWLKASEFFEVISQVGCVSGGKEWQHAFIYTKLWMLVKGGDDGDDDDDAGGDNGVALVQVGKV